MSVENNKLMNLADGKVLYDDLRGRVDATKGMIAPDYADLTFPVLAGQGCVHDGVRYKAKQDIPTSEAWTAAHWEAEKIEGALSSVKNEMDTKADVIINTKTGSIVTLTDAVANEPLTGCVVQFSPVQAGNGDPAPENQRPITGFTGAKTQRTGKNLFYIPSASGTYAGVTYNYNAETNTLTKSGTSGNNGGYNLGLFFLSAGTYVFSANFSSDEVGTYVYLRDKATGTNVGYVGKNKTTQQIIITKETEYYFRVASAEGATAGSISEFQIELGETATSYEPYTGETVSVTFPAFGKNLADMQYGNQVPSVSTGQMVSSNGWSSPFIPIDKNKNYVVSIQGTYTSGDIYTMFYDSDYSFLGYSSNNTTFRLDFLSLFESASFIKLRNDSTEASEIDIQLEIGTTETAYEPFTNTAYGGTISPLTGVLTVDFIKKSARWGDIKTGSPDETTGYYSAQIPFGTDVVRSVVASDQGVNAFCNVAKIRWELAHKTPQHYYIYGNPLNTAYIYGDFDDDTEIDIVVKLITPLVYQLTPAEIKTLLSNPNNLWADIGDISVLYKADTKSYVDQHEGVTDVKVAGSSVVTDGVANVPIADGTNPGVVIVRAGNDGLSMDSYNRLNIARASSAQIKSGDNGYRAIAPYSQHESVFYGLAKLAGADMASSSNAVGTFTDAAKVAIQKMLGIYEPPFELVNDFTLESESGINLSADLNNIPYNFRDVIIRIYYPANTPTASTGYGRYRFYDANNAYVYCETGKYSTNTAAWFKVIQVERKGNMTSCYYTQRNPTGGSGAWLSKDIAANSIRFDLGEIVKIVSVENDVEPAGTRIQIYAQRAY